MPHKGTCPSLEKSTDKLLLLTKGWEKILIRSLVQKMDRNVKVPFGLRVGLY